jgi:hypothetical protein
MIRELLAVLQPLIERLDERVRAAVAADPELRARLREFGRALIALAADPEPVAAEPTPVPAEPPPAAAPPEPIAAAATADLPAPVRPGRPAEPEWSAGWQPEPIADDELPVIAARCRLKADGARWAAERQRRLREGADFRTEIDPLDKEIVERARGLPNCFLWMCYKHNPAPDEFPRYADLAGCFDATAAAAELLAGLTSDPPRPDMVEQALAAAAEAQSALRTAVARVGHPTPDNDQVRLFRWLGDAAAARGIWLSRHMRLTDPADPTAWAAIRDRIRQAEGGIQDLKDRDRKRVKLLNKIRYHRKRIDDDPAVDHASDWETILRTADELVEGGLPPSNVELRELLLPILDAVPAGLDRPKGFQLVAREIDRFRAESADRTDEGLEDEAPTPEVRRAADLLRGRAVVLIGGSRRPASADALVRAFDLSDLIWIEGTERSYTAFEPHVARPDVAAVLLAIRWSSHGFSEVREFCDKYDKPLVHLPGGYGRNQVAYQIVTQVADRLAAQAGVGSAYG